MDVLEHLNQVNDVEIKSVYDDEFASFGRVLSGYDFTDMISYMRDNTDIPENGIRLVHRYLREPCRPYCNRRSV